MTKLQVAVDLLTTAEALALTNKVAPYVDIIELGTPLIKSAGLSCHQRDQGCAPGQGGLRRPQDC